MLSIAKAGSAAYYAGFAHGDYYLEGGEPLGRWLGDGCRHFGLEGTVERDQFEALAAGFHPSTGEAQVQNAGKDGRQIGWDLTFSAPKTVSIAWALSDDATRQAIQEAQFAAVQTAFGYLQQQAGFTRTGKGGEQTARALLTGAAFEHGTSRAQDPQLHTHLFLMNVGIGPDGKSRTLKTEELYRHKMAAGALYRAELAHQLQRLGFDAVRHSHYETETVKNPLYGTTKEKSRTHAWFELAGIPQELVDHFSKRRQEVVSALEGKGAHSAEAANIAALATRTKKEHLPRKENLERWQEEARGLGYELKPMRREVQPTKDNEKELLNRLHDALSRKESFTRRDVVRRLAIEAQDYGRLPGAACVQLANRALREDPRFQVRFGEEGEERRWTTQAYIALERKLGENLERAQKQRSFRFSDRDLERQAKKHELEDQERKQLGTATRSGRVSTVDELTDKGLVAARDLYERAGYRVLALGTTKERTEELQELLGEKSAESAYSLLWQYRSHMPTLKQFFGGMNATSAMRAGQDGVWGRSPEFAQQEADGWLKNNAMWVAGQRKTHEKRWHDLRRRLPSKTVTMALVAVGRITKGQKKYLDWQRERAHLALDKKTVLIVEQGEKLTAQRTQELLELAEKKGAKLILCDQDRHRPRHREELEAKLEEQREEKREEQLEREEEARQLRAEQQRDMELER